MVCNVSAFLCLNANSDHVYVSSSFNFTILFLGGDELGKVDLFNYYLSSVCDSLHSGGSPHHHHHHQE